MNLRDKAAMHVGIALSKLFDRKEGVGNRDDPTAWTSFTRRVVNVEVKISAVWDVTLEVSRWNGHSWTTLVFASPVRNKWLWKVADAIVQTIESAEYLRNERDYADADFDDPFPARWA